VQLFAVADTVPCLATSVACCNPKFDPSELFLLVVMRARAVAVKLVNVVLSNVFVPIDDRQCLQQ